MIKEIQRKVEVPGDLDAARAILQGVLGNACADVALGYADELCVCIGDQVALLNAGGRKFPLYAWELTSRGTYWQMVTSEKNIVTSRDRQEEIRANVQPLKEARILSCEITYPSLGLVVTFSNDYELEIRPTVEDATYEMAYWRLLTPALMVLEAGPGPYWSYTRADVP